MHHKPALVSAEIKHFPLGKESENVYISQQFFIIFAMGLNGIILALGSLMSESCKSCTKQITAEYTCT